MRRSTIAAAAMAFILLFAGLWGCSKSKQASQQPAPTPTPTPAPTIEPAATGPTQNIAAAERGGEIESTGEQCAFNTSLLIDKRLDPVWSAPTPVKFPQEFVLSF